MWGSILEVQQTSLFWACGTCWSNTDGGIIPLPTRTDKSLSLSIHGGFPSNLLDSAVVVYTYMVWVFMQQIKQVEWVKTPKYTISSSPIWMISLFHGQFWSDKHAKTCVKKTFTRTKHVRCDLQNSSIYNNIIHWASRAGSQMHLNCIWSHPCCWSWFNGWNRWLCLLTKASVLQNLNICSNELSMKYLWMYVENTVF